MSLAVGDAARQEDGTLGVVCLVHFASDVKLLLEDGSITGYINTSALARPSEVELAAGPWTAECWVHLVKMLRGTSMVKGRSLRQASRRCCGC